MKAYENRYWSSRDGLKLHFRDYPAAPVEAGAVEGSAIGESRPPILCLHGLTRNARDFDVLAPRLAAAGWRVLCPDMRGRGDSEYARDAHTYTPVRYCDDVLALLEQEGIERFVAIGTSLGGLMTMGLATVIPERIAGAVLNDVGPVLDPAGLERIKGYVGSGRSFPTWVHAARGLETTHERAYPGQPLDFWIGMAKRVMVVNASGRIAFDYDMKVAEPFKDFDPATQPDLWPAWEALAQHPVTVVRGALSDLLDAATLDEMVRRARSAEAVTLPGIGHAPTLDEPESVAAIERLLARVA